MSAAVTPDDLELMQWAKIGECVNGGFKVLSRESVDRGRWEEYIEVVFEDIDGRLWGFTYSEGLTEEQDYDNNDWEGMDVYGVVAEEKTITVYRKAN